MLNLPISNMSLSNYYGTGIGKRYDNSVIIYTGLVGHDYYEVLTDCLDIITIRLNGDSDIQNGLLFPIPTACSQLIFNILPTIASHSHDIDFLFKIQQKIINLINGFYALEDINNLNNIYLTHQLRIILEDYLHDTC